MEEMKLPKKHSNTNYEFRQVNETGFKPFELVIKIDNTESLAYLLTYLKAGMILKDNARVAGSAQIETMINELEFTLKESCSKTYWGFEERIKVLGAYIRIKI